MRCLAFKSTQKKYMIRLINTKKINENSAIGNLVNHQMMFYYLGAKAELSVDSIFID